MYFESLSALDGFVNSDGHKISTPNRSRLRLAAGLKKLGLGIASQEGHQLWQLNAVTVPEETDEAQVRKRLLEEYQIEVGAGLGPMKGKIWRVGLMGESSTAENVDRYLDAMTQILAH